jgi:hypothetical protein
MSVNVVAAPWPTARWGAPPTATVPGPQPGWPGSAPTFQVQLPAWSPRPAGTEPGNAASISCWASNPQPSTPAKLSTM